MICRQDLGCSSEIAQKHPEIHRDKDEICGVAFTVTLLHGGHGLDWAYFFMQTIELKIFYKDNERNK